MKPNVSYNVDYFGELIEFIAYFFTSVADNCCNLSVGGLSEVAHATTEVAVRIDSVCENNNG